MPDRSLRTRGHGGSRFRDPRHRILRLRQYLILGVPKMGPLVSKRSQRTVRHGGSHFQDPPCQLILDCKGSPASLGGTLQAQPFRANVWAFFFFWFLLLPQGRRKEGPMYFSVSFSFSRSPPLPAVRNMDSKVKSTALKNCIATQRMRQSPCPATCTQAPRLHGSQVAGNPSKIHRTSIENQRNINRASTENSWKINECACTSQKYTIIHISRAAPRGWVYLLACIVKARKKESPPPQ